MHYRKENKGKKLILIFAIVLVAVVAAVFVVHGISNRKSYRTVSVVEVSGRVGVVKDGMEYSAYPGMMLQEGHEIVTSGDSYVRLVLDADKYIKLEPGSKLTFETLGVLGSGKTRLCLERGAMTTEVTKPLGIEEEYVVNTPNAILAVRGTFFRVEITRSKTGEVFTDVLTFGGQVASNRIMPDGEVKDEDVLIDAGWKAQINMTAIDTFYVISDIPVETGDADDCTEPIVNEDISDADLVDIYYASESGHALFLTTQEAKEEIEARDIDLEDTASVYEKARKYIVEASGMTESAHLVVANDSQTLVRLEETEQKAQATGAGGSLTDAGSTGSSQLTGTISDGKGDMVHVHVETAGGEENVHAKCISCGAALEDGSSHSFTEQKIDATCVLHGKLVYECACGYAYEKEIPAKGHVESDGGSAGAHVKCSVCGETLEDTHKPEEVSRTDATCVLPGRVVYECACGYGYEETIPAKGHTEAYGGEADVHTECSVCGETIEDGSGHSFTESASDASCTSDGTVSYECSCGYGYEEAISATGHSETTGGEKDVHAKCSSCGLTMADGSKHSFTKKITAATCTAAGKEVYSCSCGYSYEEAIPATGHTEVDGAVQEAHVKCSVCGETLQNGDSHVFTEISRTDATCTASGEVVYECSCGYGYEEELPATGHSEVVGGEADVHVMCHVCGETLENGSYHQMSEISRTDATCTASGKVVYECSCGYDYEEELPASGHAEVAGGEENVHMKCDTCGVPLEDGSSHSYTESIRAATCTVAGATIYTCSCGYRYEDPIPSTGHVEVPGGEDAIHVKCDICGEVIETGAAHEISEISRTDATCTVDGLVVYGCPCGYETAQILYAPGVHSEEYGGEADVHTKCSVCGETLQDGSYHGTGGVTVEEATCTEEGLMRYSCYCGYSYDEVIPVKGHEKANEWDTSCVYCGEPWITINTSTFPDAVFREYVLQNIDTNGDGDLFGDELSVQSINVAGTSETDGGVADLTGISYFTELTSLNCSYNSGLTLFDVSLNRNLLVLDCSATGITSLNNVLGPANMRTLTELNCSNTDISSVDLSQFEALQTLTCRNTQVTSLAFDNSTVETADVGGNTLLNELNTYNNANLTEILADDCPALLTASLGDNAVLTTISVKNATSMTSFSPSYNPCLTSIDISGSNAITGGIYMTGSGTTSGSITVTATGTGLTTSSFINWNDSYMTLIN